MSDPHPTKTRLTLLRDIDDEKVATGPDGEIYNEATSPARKVSDRVAELYRARWVKPVRRDDRQAWALDDAGLAVLVAASV